MIVSVRHGQLSWLDKNILCANRKRDFQTLRKIKNCREGGHSH